MLELNFNYMKKKIFKYFLAIKIYFLFFFLQTKLLKFLNFKL